jgi:hypothetical protein
MLTQRGLLRLREAEDRIVDSSIPVYRQMSRGTPELIGSAVILEIGASTLLCTAAHVIEARRGANLYLPHGDTLQPAALKSFVTSLPGSGHRADDKFDFAISLLDEEQKRRFSNFRVISLAEIDQNEIPEARRRYSFFGYPASKNKSKPHVKDVRFYSSRYSGGPSPPEKYDEYGFNVSLHLLVEFNAKRMLNREGRAEKPADPHGVSGGAVWCLGDESEFEAATNREKLIGIAMEYRRDALVALRLSLVLESVRKLLPELSPHIPKSKWVGARVRVTAPAG